MLPGIDGHLLARAFIQQHLSANGVSTGSEDLVQARRRLAGWRVGCATLGPASSPRTILQSAAPLFATLGFEPAERIEPADPGIAATLRSRDRAVALLVSPWGDRHESLWRPAVTQAARRSASWCLVFNGLQLRIVDATRLYARRHLEIDLDLALDNPLAFAALLNLFGAPALGSGPGDPRSLHALVGESDRHAAGVCRSLREGVLGASAEILRALVAGKVRRPANTAVRPDGDRRANKSVVADSFEQALTIVYRILFLLFAEARDLVPHHHPVYRNAYAVGALCREAIAAEPARGLWDALGAITRLSRVGCRADDLIVRPFNGRLFARSAAPSLEQRPAPWRSMRARSARGGSVRDAALQHTLVALSTRPGAAGRETISYADLGVEQLGAVYERVLDLEPAAIGQARPDVVPARAPKTGGASRHSARRKESGTFYTPQPLCDFVVRRTLAPLVSGATSDAILALRVVDPAMGSGAFLVAACRYLATAYEQAIVEEGRAGATDLDEQARADIRRLIAERCLAGVDANPVAVQLARLSLWLATLADGKPLGFLDHRLRVGNSLIGASPDDLRRIPDGRRRTAVREFTLPLFDESDLEHIVRTVARPLAELTRRRDDTVEDVHAKEAAWAALVSERSPLRPWRLARLRCLPSLPRSGRAH
jgi:hypothetical protein